MTEGSDTNEHDYCKPGSFIHDLGAFIEPDHNDTSLPRTVQAPDASKPADLTQRHTQQGLTGSGSEPLASQSPLWLSDPHNIWPPFDEPANDSESSTAPYHFPSVHEDNQATLLASDSLFSHNPNTMSFTEPDPIVTDEQLNLFLLQSQRGSYPLGSSSGGPRMLDDWSSSHVSSTSILGDSHNPFTGRSTLPGNAIPNLMRPASLSEAPMSSSRLNPGPSCQTAGIVDANGLLCSPYTDHVDTRQKPRDEKTRISKPLTVEDLEHDNSRFAKVVKAFLSITDQNRRTVPEIARSVAEMFPDRYADLEGVKRMVNDVLQKHKAFWHPGRGSPYRLNLAEGRARREFPSSTKTSSKGNYSVAQNNRDRRLERRRRYVDVYDRTSITQQHDPGAFSENSWLPPSYRTADEFPFTGASSYRGTQFTSSPIQRPFLHEETQPPSFYGSAFPPHLDVSCINSDIPTSVQQPRLPPDRQSPRSELKEEVPLTAIDPRLLFLDTHEHFPVNSPLPCSNIDESAAPDPPWFSTDSVTHQGCQF
ncbi:hypothetical protein BD410DRAFT_895360 [Rickenella mellea]|uniref:Uncharacterized protein n=1 Tax=Rickenella mellea TaxID=50990 RepID=A0A4Y7QGD6_9AGAM|nr:hypothetical protein BD410DRAFT_895360 [Rickenella mellea]